MTVRISQPSTSVIRRNPVQEVVQVKGGVRGIPGDPGPKGDPGVLTGSVEPTDPDITLWVDTSEPYTPDTPQNVILTVLHGSDPNFPRPNVATVYWKGTVAPNAFLNGDMWYDTTGDV